jgi:hypothetical protein
VLRCAVPCCAGHLSLCLPHPTHPRTHLPPPCLPPGRGELEEVLRYIKPQHFLPVHGEYAFLCAHAQLARENQVIHTSVIRNGQMLGVHERRNAKTISSGSLASVLGEVSLTNFYNDGNKVWVWVFGGGGGGTSRGGEEGHSLEELACPPATPDCTCTALYCPAPHPTPPCHTQGTGSAAEMGLEERQLIANEGIVIASVDIVRHPAVAQAADLYRRKPGDPAAAAYSAQEASKHRLKARVRLTTRAMWVDRGRLLEELHRAATSAVERLAGNTGPAAVERVVVAALRNAAKAFNQKRPEVVVVVHEADARLAAAIMAVSEGRQRMVAAEAVANAAGTYLDEDEAQEVMEESGRAGQLPQGGELEDGRMGGGKSVQDKL